MISVWSCDGQKPEVINYTEVTQYLSVLKLILSLIFLQMFNLWNMRLNPGLIFFYYVAFNSLFV